MENTPLEYDHQQPDKALEDYLHTTRYLLEGVIADQGEAFEAYLDSIAPDDAVDEMTADFMRRHYGTFQTKAEAIESVLGADYLENHSEADLWEHIETIYEVVTYANGQIFLFIPDTTGGRHG